METLAAFFCMGMLEILAKMVHLAEILDVIVAPDRASSSVRLEVLSVYVVQLSSHCSAVKKYNPTSGSLDFA